MELITGFDFDTREHQFYVLYISTCHGSDALFKNIFRLTLFSAVDVTGFCMIFVRI